MKERPILFSGPMVRAILEDRKTQTRRVITPENAHFGSAPKLFWDHCDFSKAWVDGGSVLQYLHVPCHVEVEGQCAVCDEWGWPTTVHRLWPLWWPVAAYVGSEEDQPPYQLWVRETWTGTWHGTQMHIAYAADGSEQFFDIPDVPADYVLPKAAQKPSNWVTPLFIPRWASRLALTIDVVRAQRLQAMSNEDAVAEGVTDASGGPVGVDELPRLAFRHLWNGLNAKRGFGWDVNPWVWALTFRRVA